MELTESIFDSINQPGTEDPVQEPVVAAEIQPAPEPQPAPEQPAPAPAPQPEVPVEPATEAPRAEQSVPLSVLLAQRDEMQQIKRRNAELEAARAQPVQPQTIPDPVDDPNGFAAAMREEAQSMLVRQRFEMSKEIATQQYGADAVETARQWAMERASKDPAFDMSLGNQPHPIAWIVQQHKRDGLLSKIGDDPDAYVRQRAAELGYQIAPAPAAVAALAPTMGQPAPAAVAQPPRSLASAPGSGGGVADVPTGPMSALGAVFK